MKNWLAEIRTSLSAVAALAVLLCVLYPLVVWVLAQPFFPARANGSLIVRDGRDPGIEPDRPEIRRPGIFPSPALRGGEGL